MTDEAIAKFLQQNADYFVQNNFIADFFRMIGWFFTKIFSWGAQQCEKLYDTTFNLVDFTTWGGVSEFVNSFKVVFVAIMVLSVVAIGIILIINPEKKPNVLVNLLIAMAVVTTSTVLLNDLNALVISGKDAILSDSTSSNVNQIVANNMYDLLYIDKNLGLAKITPDKVNTMHYPDMSEEDIKMVSINEVINYKSEYLTTPEAKEILKKHLMYVYGESTNKVDDVYNGLGWNSADDNDLLNEFYYRYKVDYFSTLVSLAAILILYLLMSYKVFRIIFELAIAEVLAITHAADLTGGQKTIKILHNIKDSYIVLLFTAVIIKTYYLCQDFLTERVDNTFLRCLLIIFLAFSAIDGPNLIEKLTGIDAGLSGGAGKLMGMYGMTRAVAGMGASIKNMATGGSTRAMRNAWEQQHNDSAAQTEALNNMVNGNSESNHSEMGKDSNVSGNTKNNQMNETEATSNSQEEIKNSEGTNTSESPNLDEQNQNIKEMNGINPNSDPDAPISALNENSNISALNGFDPEKNSMMENDNKSMDSVYGSNETLEKDSGLNHSGLSDYIEPDQKAERFVVEKNQDENINKKEK